MRTRRLKPLRSADILEEMRACPVVYLPLGALEWHEPHLPYGTDPLYAYEFALRLAATDAPVGFLHRKLHARA